MTNPLRTVLVTGAGGYIGSVLVPELINRGYEVRALDKYTRSSGAAYVHPNLIRIYADTRTWGGEGLEGADAVIDLAAISHDRRGEITPHETLDINQFARHRTAVKAKESGVRRYLLISTCGVYGFQDSSCMASEESDIAPVTTYARAAGQSERDILRMNSASFEVTAARPAILYGYSPRMRFDLAVNAMVLAAWREGIIRVAGSGGQWRPFVHIRDAVEAFCRLLDAPADQVAGEIYNIGSDEGNILIRSLAELIADTLPVPVQIITDGDEDNRSYRIDFTKSKDRLGWKAVHGLRQGIAEIYGQLERGVILPDAK
ncbi:NAD(P)-dependent oxidoreductase [Paenibacillus sp. FJAT-26967]|uniref:NAD-dependent epimerase/dehydratase family protein n=1 Tax=Paenibacillus sp. FJAT-26967 TaxID=1729690 RepID=UPI0008380428|nr:NAD(P)-dependent oxidoreductase [Paenibacillus sp. FJAT-26967]